MTGFAMPPRRRLAELLVEGATLALAAVYFSWMLLKHHYKTKTQERPSSTEW